MFTQSIITILITALLVSLLTWLFINYRRDMKRKSADPAPGQSPSAHQPLTADGSGIAARQLQLQAYERLILLIDRIALPNLIQRVNQPDFSAREMQSLLTHSIRQEFEHNITQQIYVSAEAWDAVRNYKEQNILIINQISSFLPPEATGLDLVKHVLDLLVQNPQASLQNVVSDALSYEAKKLM